MKAKDNIIVIEAMEEFLDVCRTDQKFLKTEEAQKYNKNLIADFCELLSLAKSKLIGNIKIEGHIGTWYVAEEFEYKGEIGYFLESEQFGDETGWIAVKDDLKTVILDDIYNGMLDLVEAFGEDDV